MPLQTVAANLDIEMIQYSFSVHQLVPETLVCHLCTHEGACPYFTLPKQVP